MRLLILTICLMVTFKVLGQTVYSIPFVWSDAELNGEHFAKTSMHIPVKLSGDSSTYYFQFDTGANKSFLYTKGNTDSTLVKRCNNGDSILSNIGPLHLMNSPVMMILGVIGTRTFGVPGLGKMV